jgi:hypothetical protein
MVVRVHAYSLTAAVVLALAASAPARSDELLRAARAHRADLEGLVSLHEAAEAQAARAAGARRALSAQGAATAVEVETAEKALAGARAKVEEIRREMSAVDALIAEAGAWAPAVRAAAPPSPAPAAHAVVRNAGSGRWALAGVAEVQSFFATRFGRALPVSAFGQTALHSRLGFDHGNAVDVAVHPDSPEGRALVEFLRAAGIPFLAFRGAVPGVATGAHIHIGRPSHRL